MGGTSSSQSTSNQTQQTQPWPPTQTPLNNLVAALGLQVPNLTGTPQTQAAYNQLYNIGQTPNALAGPALQAAGQQLAGAPNYGAGTALLNTAYGNTAAALSPYVSGSALNPMTNPALAQQLGTVQQDVMNQVNPLFASAGRIGSPMNYQALARGITQGESPILQNAATNQLQAIGALQQAGLGTASGLTQQDLTNMGIMSQGLQNANTAYGVQSLGPSQSLAAALGQEQLPFTQGQQLAGILGGLGNMFGLTTGTGQQQGTQTMSGAQQFATIAGGLGGLGSFFKAL
jgi:hypothetical protein